MSTSVAARVKVIPDLFAVNVGNDDLKVTAIASFFVSSDKFFYIECSTVRITK